MIDQIATNPVAWFVLFILVLASVVAAGTNRSTSTGVLQSAVVAPVAPAIPIRSALKINFDEKHTGCRVRTKTNDEPVIFFRAIVETESQADDGARAYLTKIFRRDMAGQLEQIGAEDRRLLTFVAEGAGGPTSFTVVHRALPKFLDLLFVGEHSGIMVATEGFSWPYSWENVFKSPGVYVLDILLVSTLTGLTTPVQFQVQWSGKWDETRVSLR